MELLWIFGIWIFLLYIIRIHKELYFYRKIYHQHKDIYVPSYKELINNKIWEEQLSGFLAEFLKMTFAKISLKNFSFIRKNNNLTVLTLPTSNEKI